MHLRGPLLMQSRPMYRTQVRYIGGGAKSASMSHRSYTMKTYLGPPFIH